MVNDHRLVVVIVGIVALVVLVGSCAVALAFAPGNAAATIVPLIIAMAAPTIAGLMALLKTADNAHSLNGAMDAHLKNARTIGSAAAKQMAADSAPVMADAVRQAAVEAVNSAMQGEFHAAKAAKANKKAGG